MNHHPQTIDTPAQTLAQPVSPTRAAAAAKMGQLADWAMDLAGRAHARAVKADDAGDTETADAATAGFARIARSVPRFLACQEHFEKPARAEAELRSDSDRERARAARLRRGARRNAVRKMVEQSANTRPNIRDVRWIMRDVDDRLADPDMLDALDTREIIEIVVKLCNEIGIVPDLGQWSDADLRIILDNAGIYEAEELNAPQPPWPTPRPKPPPSG
jgi:hypothetical protein